MHLHPATQFKFRLAKQPRRTRDVCARFCNLSTPSAVKTKRENVTHELAASDKKGAHTDTTAKLVGKIIGRKSVFIGTLLHTKNAG